jgi:hypothetical protein
MCVCVCPNGCKCFRVCYSTTLFSVFYDTLEYYGCLKLVIVKELLLGWFRCCPMEFSPILGHPHDIQIFIRILLDCVRHPRPHSPAPRVCVHVFGPLSGVFLFFISVFVFIIKYAIRTKFRCYYFAGYNYYCYCFSVFFYAGNENFCPFKT